MASGNHYPLEETKCEKCGADIVFRTNDNTRNLGPIDAKPVLDGNVTLWPNGDYHVMKKGEVPKGERYVSHYVTCPNKASFGRNKKR